MHVFPRLLDAIDGRSLDTAPVPVCSDQSRQQYLIFRLPLSSRFFPMPATNMKPVAGEVVMSAEPELRSLHLQELLIALQLLCCNMKVGGFW